MLMLWPILKTLDSIHFARYLPTHSCIGLVVFLPNRLSCQKSVLRNRSCCRAPPWGGPELLPKAGISLP